MGSWREEDSTWHLVPQGPAAKDGQGINNEWKDEACDSINKEAN
jgi:hypothetical protein